MWNPNITPERWHNHHANSPTTLYQTYGSPLTWFRRGFYTTNKTESDVIKDNYKFIRAAAVFKTNIPLTPLTINTEYSLICNFEYRGWKIMLVSCQDPVAWLSRAYESGAVAWWLCKPGAVYQYEPVVYPDAREETDSIDAATPRGAGIYDREQVLWDLKHTSLSQQAIGNKHGITRSMVSLIARELRQLDQIEPKITCGPRSQVDPKLVPLIKRDVMSGKMNKDMIAAKHGVSTHNITNIINKHGLAGYLPRGTSTAKLLQKYFKKTP